ncbi:Oidioi.mRNA.OKI2018_I69.chr2.g4539.t1.cds [Oikopleura dioica]|uniref:Oidioi.mRNA.OKI2018_I69.chr2.g4539.t1.cds n=1 Tax=Oikopleura dioica TaxID=34765 RepID=A0ABN7T1Y2_OIKDI|nr:Oidioi.mRNA.OKI2018_I69.chr2.g4539.t1.cds [Oikopleura dioica]
MRTGYLLPALIAKSLADVCPDLSKGERCQSKCSGDLDYCSRNCQDGDFSCVTRCQGEFLDCTQNCPCGPNCPICDSCPENEFCSYRDLLILNPRQAGIGKGLLIDTFSQTYTAVDYDYAYPANIEDSCSVVFRGVPYVLGSYFQYRQIAIVGRNALEVQDEELSIPHVDGYYGSCSVFADAVSLCFYTGLSKSCNSWRPGEVQEEFENDSQIAHDWASMVTFQNQLVTVGGCAGGICHNKMEFFDGSSWTYGPDLSVAEISGHVLTTDQESIFLFGGQRRSPENVLRYQSGRWTTLGKLNESRVWLSSAIQLGHFVYTGSCRLEKVDVIGKFSTTVVVPDENGKCDLDLYYATIFEFPSQMMQ